MYENQADAEGIEERLVRMERALQRWRLYSAILVPLSVVLLVAGATTEHPEKELRVQKLRIVDRDAKDRVVLSADPTEPDMTFLDPAGQSRLTIDIADDHKPVLQFSEGREEKGRLSIGIEGGVPMLQIFDRDGKPRLTFGIPKLGGPALKILDADGRLQTRFP